MTSSLRFAGAAALCAALLLTACAKKTDQTTTTSTDTTQTATGAPASGTGATTAPDAAATVAPNAAATTAVKVDVKTSTSGSSGFIDMPIYPGATESKDQTMSMSTNEGSLTSKVYTTGDDPKKVAEWYKSHLPASWKGGVVSAGGKTIGTFANEVGDGNQSVMVVNQDDKTTRIQLTTKHGK